VRCSRFDRAVAGIEAKRFGSRDCGRKAPGS
jgi:hypothetical protein